MKTILRVVIESPDRFDNVYPLPLDEKAPEDYKTPEEIEERDTFQESFPRNIHDAAVEVIEEYLSDNNGDLSIAVLDEIADREYAIEEWGELDDYDIEIKVSNETERKGGYKR